MISDYLAERLKAIAAAATVGLGTAATTLTDVCASGKAVIAGATAAVAAFAAVWAVPNKPKPPVV